MFKTLSPIHFSTTLYRLYPKTSLNQTYTLLTFISYTQHQDERKGGDKMKKLNGFVLIAVLLVALIAFSANVFAATNSTVLPAPTTSQTEKDANEADEVETATEVAKEKLEKATEVNDVDDAVTAAFITDVSTYFKIAEPEVVKLNTTGSEQGEIFFTCYFASETKKPTSEIAQLKADGKGWGEIAKENNLKPGSHGRAMGQFRSGK
jgi:biopolymer transport protein ExbD